MTSSLRTVLVVVAGVATTLAGVMGPPTAASFAAPSIHELAGRLADGTREDDSGRPAEAFEEDDTEKQGDREIHLLATVALAGLETERGCVAAADSGGEKPGLHHAASSIRGPPARG